VEVLKNKVTVLVEGVEEGIADLGFDFGLKPSDRGLFFNDLLMNGDRDIWIYMILISSISIQFITKSILSCMVFLPVVSNLHLQ
jgi:hypothetical protein